MGTANSLERTLILGKIESPKEKRESDNEMAGWHP